MKSINKIPALTLLVIVLCITITATWFYSVPQCTAQFARKFGIRSDYSEVKNYVMESIQIGMTSDEVIKTLGQFGTVSVVNQVASDDDGVIKQIVVEICRNPWGNIFLDLAFTSDGVLLSVHDSNPQ